MTSRPLSRRRVLEGLIAVPAAAFLLGACNDEDSSSSSAATSSSNSSTTTSSSVASSALAAETSETTEATTPTASGAWASGGTDLITVAYPDDSIFAAANTCAISLTAGTTEGPCYFSSDTGEDISLGKTGLPTQLCLQLVDNDCNPLADHVIEAWHCDTRGIYSGDTSSSANASSFAGDFCTAGDAEAEAATYFRGQLTTDTNGRVNFKTCFPGWYAGRTIHIHFAVTDPDGTTRVISQFCFADDFAEEICTTHDLYADRGVQDTPLAAGSDTVFPASGYEDYMLSLQQNTDGTLLAYSVIQIDPTTTASAGAGGGAGQPPAGGGGGDRPEPPTGG